MHTLLKKLHFAKKMQMKKNFSQPNMFRYYASYLNLCVVSNIVSQEQTIG